MSPVKYSFLDFAEDVLRTATVPMTFQEIWAAGTNQGLAEKLASTGKTPWQSLGAQLFVAVRDNPNSKFTKTSSNPARFFLTTRLAEVPAVQPDEPAEDVTTVAQTKASYHERKLHPLVAHFAFTNTEFNRGRQVYTKTIYHEKSTHSTPAEWVHPDMVGFYSPVEAWNSALIEFSKVTDKTAIRLYSFEIKKVINRSNYRECFFQAVSNSSWAHEGYLVAAAIQQDDELRSELERLSSSFGIGIVELNLDDFYSSRVLYPAQVRDTLDWETMNKLCRQNRDFETFIGDVQRDFAGRKIHASEYDQVIADPEAHIASLRATPASTRTP